jgi:hypothetical protein
MSRGTAVAWAIVILAGAGIGLLFGAKESTGYSRLDKRLTVLEQRMDSARVEAPEAIAREARSP